MGNSSSSSGPPLEVAPHCDTAKFMGTWFVIAVKPTYLEKTCSNAVENYTWYSKGEKKHDIGIDFKYNQADPITSKLKSLPQKGWITGPDKKDSGAWMVSPCWPIKMPYLILEVDETNYEYTVIGFPTRQYCWIMARKPVMPEATYKMLTEKLEKTHQYSLEGLRKVPQVWTKAEREKRGLTSKEIPDELLQNDLN